MNDSSISLKKIILAIIKAFIIPLIAIFILKKWNLFLYITFIPEDQRYDVGLTFYVALFEIIISALAEYLETKHAHVKLIFFEVKSNENINNVPTIICNSNYGTASLSCHIILHGDYKLLKKCQIKMDYPSWLTTQISSTDTILSAKNNTLYYLN